MDRKQRGRGWRYSDTAVTLRMYALANEESVHRAAQTVRGALEAQNKNSGTGQGKPLPGPRFKSNAAENRGFWHLPAH